MHARVSWGRVEAERWDEFEQAFDSRVGSVGPVDGLRARLLLRDTGSPDIGFAMSIWENEAAMRRYESSEHMRNRIVPLLDRFFARGYSTSLCEVKYMEVWPDAAVQAK